MRVLWKGKGLEPFPLRGFHRLDIQPTEYHPFGERGKVLIMAWYDLNDDSTTGMLLLDGDVAIDPEDMRYMFQAIDSHPASVHTAPIKLWPHSTKRTGWVWGHTLTQRSIDPSRRFTFGFTYIPRRLWEVCECEIRDWRYPVVDMHMSQKAHQFDIPINVVHKCQPKHLNY